jgi:hypothetical protein
MNRRTKKGVMLELMKQIGLGVNRIEVNNVPAKRLEPTDWNTTSAEILTSQ